MNKLKLLLFGIIGFLTFSTVPTYAITFKGDSNSAKIISGYNNFSYQDYSNGFYGCIWENYKTNANLQRESSGCSDGYYTVRGHYSSYGALRINDSAKSSYGGYKLRNKQGSPDIFALPKYRNGEETIYRKITMKNLASKMLSVKSQRGENVYDEAFVDGIGFVALVKDDNQARAAHVIANSYILDGYLLAISYYDSYIVDTYTNKIYKYNKNFYSSEMQTEGVAHIFPKLWNTVPDQVSDVVRGLPSRHRITVNSEDLYFDITNTQTGTKATLADLRENIKKSIIILDQEGAEFFLGETPESYGIGTGQPNTENELNTSGFSPENKSPDYNLQLAEYNSCNTFWNNVKIYAKYDRECYRSLLDSAPLTGSYDAKKIISPWERINNWNGEGELDIGSEDRLCLIYKQRKEVYKKVRNSQRLKFEEIAKEYWLNPEQISVTEQYGSRPEKKENFLDKINIFKGIDGESYFQGMFGGTGLNDYKLFNDWSSLKVACKSIKPLVSWGRVENPEKCKGISDVTFEKYKSEKMASSGDSETDGSLYISGWEKIVEPFYSGYNNYQFVTPVCGSFVVQEFDIFAYLLFLIIVVYFLKFI